MPPKAKEGKKKLTKKEKEALKKAELDRLAEEQRLAEVAEAERLEKERLQREEEMRIANEIAAKVAAELAERRVIEDKENAPLLQDISLKLVGEEREREEESEWAKYIACHVLPDVQSEASVNTYITEWGESPRLELEPCLAECERTAHLLAQLEEAHLLALRKPGVDPDALWHPHALSQLGRMIVAKLDEVTGDVLAVADERATSRNELQLAARVPSIKYALWVNLARNPRVKAVEFPEVGITIELPKALALASVAIRVEHLRREFVWHSYRAAGAYQVLGGVTIVDLLSLPPVPKRVKGWTLRQVGSAEHTVNRLPYPIPTIGGDSAAPTVGTVAPLRLTLSLAKDVVIADKMVRVGWWDEESKAWSLEGVGEIRYDGETRSLSFLTVHLCGLAVLQHTHAQLPYKKWTLTPTASSRSVLAMHTARYLVVIDVSADGCMLVEPRLPELQQLLNQRMPPPVLLGKLQQAGLNLCPTEHDAVPLSAQLEPKHPQLESEALRLLLMLSPSFVLANSKWNPSRPPDKFCVRVTPNVPVDEDDELDLPALSAEPKTVDYFAGSEGAWAWCTLLCSDRYAAILLSAETDSAMAVNVHGKEEIARGEVAHGSPLNCFKERHPEVLHELSHCSAHYMALLHQLMAQLRLLSFTAGSS